MPSKRKLAPTGSLACIIVDDQNPSKEDPLQPKTMKIEKKGF